MKAFVKFISKEGRKSIALATPKTFGDFESQGAPFGFVTIGSAEAKAKYTLGMEVELPDNATVVLKDTKKADGTAAKVPVWVW
jgi:hypothetical protein